MAICLVGAQIALDLSEVGGSYAALEVQKLRFVFEARERMAFPDGTSTNTLRGALGTTLRKMMCSPECTSAATCKIRADCAYASIFEPRPSGTGPSGLANWPRPFVFRAGHLDGKTFDSGQNFHFDLHLFDARRVAQADLISAFAQLGLEGLGLCRKKVELVHTETAMARLFLDSEVGDERRVTVRFVTPTELKSGARLVNEPEFGVLMARVRDRISTLCELYGSGAPAIDFKGFGERAALVQMIRCCVHPVEVKRRSSRTGQIHSIGGFVGEAEYEGSVGEFIPWLKAAWWTGVGRQTVWGKGIIEVSGTS